MLVSRFLCFFCKKQIICILVKCFKIYQRIDPAIASNMNEIRKSMPLTPWKKCQRFLINDHFSKLSVSSHFAVRLFIGTFIVRVVTIVIAMHTAATARKEKILDGPEADKIASRITTRALKGIRTGIIFPKELNMDFSRFSCCSYGSFETIG